MGYKALYSKQFHEQLMELSGSVYERAEHSIDVVLDEPGLLRDYGPSYDAAFPPVDCKWYLVPGSTKVLYLSIEYATRQMRFLYLGDTREDPLHRFDRMRNAPEHL